MNRSLTKNFRQAYVEITNICNLNCPFCPGTKRDKEFMDPVVFAQIAEQVRPLVKQVYLHLMGEPLLHPNFATIIDICAELGLIAEITTNGTMLRSEAAQSLLNPIVRQVNISLQAIFYNKTFNENIFEQIISFTQSALKNRPDLYINYRIWTLDCCKKSEISEGIKLLLKRIEQVFDFHIPSIADISWRKSRRLIGRLYLHLDTRFKWPEINSAVEPNTIGSCHALSNQFAILVNGTVVPCCLDYNGVINLGNCISEPLISILNNTRAKRMLEGFRQGKLVESLCQHCSYCFRFKTK